MELPYGWKHGNVRKKRKTRINRLGNTYKSYKRKDIVMKGADKGGEVSVSRSEIYQQEAFQQLSDTIFLLQR